MGLKTLLKNLTQEIKYKNTKELQLRSSFYYSCILNSNTIFITVVGAIISIEPIANPIAALFKSLFLSAVVDVTATIPAIIIAASKNAIPINCIYPKYFSSYFIYLIIT